MSRILKQRNSIAEDIIMDTSCKCLKCEVQHIETEMLGYFLKICKENGLGCFADGGTLLGAVRHQGFIPWDDDVDVVMFREDYFRPHIQLRYDKTTAILLPEKEQVKFNQGIFIDIFPLDGVPQSQGMRFIQWCKVQLLKRMATAIGMHNKKRNILKKLAVGLISMCGIRRLQEILNNECRRYSNSPVVTLLCINATSSTNLLYRSWYGKTLFLPFEDLFVPVPEDYHEVLRTKLQQQARQDYLFWICQNRPGESMSETKKRVFANLPPAEGVLHECQMVLNFLLKTMDGVCRENDISYWLMGGTLIGAIRHKGFIPWDDDADIGMMRNEYEKLKAVLEDNPFIELLEFYNFNGCYRIPKIVVRNSGSMLAIDIIVFDYTNQSGASLETIWEEQQKIRKRYIQALKRFKWKVLEMKTTELIKDPAKYQKATEITNSYIQQCRYLPDDGDVIIWGVDNFTSRAKDRNRIYRRDAIFPLDELEFEGKKYYVANDYMDMIIREAGDIWVFPNDAGTSKMFSNARQLLELEKVMAVWGNNLKRGDNKYEDT